MTGRRAVGTVAAIAMVVLLGGCDDGDPPAENDTQTQDVDMDQRPDPATILPDEGTAPPDELVREDLVVGDGAEASAGDRVTVHYVGVAWSTGEQFDASWDRGQPFSFTLGAQEVIEGWDRGVEGMRVGGRRRLIIPPELAYGDRGAGGVIGPGETLVFVVDLLDVQA